MARTYTGVLDLLATLRKTQRPTVTSQIERESEFRGLPRLAGMSRWLEQLGHSEVALNGLNVIHVAGTKGKGSTCAFVDSLLRTTRIEHGFPRKVGLLTSPHLECVRERIQINSTKLAKRCFTSNVLEVWDILNDRRDSSFALPRAQQLLTLTAIHVFIKDCVDVAIIETSKGGRFDTTNVFSKPAVTGITSLGLDHLQQLGPDIRSIAWHKAGIFKPGVPAMTVPQQPEALNELRRCADEGKVNLSVIQNHPSCLHTLQALPSVQISNASLALALVQSYFKGCHRSHLLSSDNIRSGLQNFYWPGRFDEIQHHQHHWFLDGAHNEMSLPEAVSWFSARSSASQHDCAKIVIFSHHSDRDGSALVRCLAQSVKRCKVQLSCIIFTTDRARNDLEAPDDVKACSPAEWINTCQIYAAVWRTEMGQQNIRIEPTIESAMDYAKYLSNSGTGAQILLTGSLRLVGGALRLLRCPATSEDSINEWQE